MSQAEIFEIKNTEMNRDELERLLMSQNQYSFERFVLRMMQIEVLDKFDE